MKITKSLSLLACLPLFCIPAFAQHKMIPAPDAREVRLIGYRMLHFPDKIHNTPAAKPTGTLQRLVRTESRQAFPQMPDYTNDSVFYFYTGDKGTQTPLPGAYGKSDFDTAYSVLHGTYACQKFYTSGKLKQNLTYYDMSPGSGPGAHQYFVHEYDTEGRILLDSFAQAGQPGANLDWKYRYAFDGQDRVSYTAYFYNAYDFSGDHYATASWKTYNGTDTLPSQDSVFTDENGNTTIRIVKHTYDSNGLILADSAYAPGLLNNFLKEVTQYTYLAGTQTATTSRIENNSWQLYSRNTMKQDAQGRYLLRQYEFYEAGAWTKIVREEKQYTYSHQSDSLPTTQMNYNNDGNNNWSLFVKYRRTFNADELIDTLYQYNNLDQPVPAYPAFVAYSYNDHKNLVRAQQHYFLDDGTEISGYYTDFFYEIATGIGKTKQKELALKLYPNPAERKVTVEIPARAGQELHLQIIDVAGKTKLDRDLATALTILDLSSYTPGIYCVKITDRKSGASGAQILVKK